MKIRLKAICAAGVAGAAAISLAACGSSSRSTGTSSTAAAANGGAGALIGVSMPTKALQRWNLDGAHLQSALQADGFKVSLQFATSGSNTAGDASLQSNQIQTMITSGAKVLVIAAVDGTSLGPVLATAHAQGVKVIAYDRLIMNTPNVDYYDTFDNEKVGTLQGNYLIDQVKAKYGASAKAINFEPFAGDSGDNNAPFFFKGAWDVISPDLTSGMLTNPSGAANGLTDASWSKVSVQGWSTATAQNIMQTRLNSFYTGGKKVQAILSPNDSVALGIEQALTAAGYSASDWPIITGQDCDLPNVKNILAGKQSMCVWKNTPVEGDIAAKMVKAIMAGQTPETNSTAYNNGSKVVPAYLSQPEVVTKDNVQSVLVGNKFYTAAQLGLS